MVMKPTPMKPPSKAGGSIVGWFRVVGDAGGCSSGVGPEMVFSGCCHAFLSWLLGISPVFFFHGFLAINGILGQLIHYPAS
jgi:hypothetical protein